ncbi:helix-turn-helix domain-containing protein [Streptomyces hydrogenans]|uniref:helix-turn-helix domain-containing protein n=1 Tax=Streptomyces hydrogenans TaxID=1873719 RepID=UPI00364F2C70
MTPDSNNVFRLARASGSEWTPTAAQIMLGREMKQLREQAGLTQSGLARSVHVSASTVNRLEHAEGATVKRTVQAVIDFLKPDVGMHDTLLMMLARAQEPEWFQKRFSDCTPEYLHRLLGLESMAIHLTTYDVRLVSGLLQTQDYSSCVIRTGLHRSEWEGEALDRRLSQRQERQDRVLGQIDPPSGIFLMDESVLLRRVGPDDVMRAQMVKLRRLADLPYVTIRFVLLDGMIAGNAAAMAGSMAQLQFGRGGLPDLVYTEGYETAEYYYRPPRRPRAGEKPLTPRQSDYERHLQLLLRIQGEACASPSQSRRMLDAAIKRYS